MKRILASITLALAACSCSDTFDIGFSGELVKRSREVPLSVTAPGCASLDLCAFGQDGLLYTHARQPGSSVSAKLAIGEVYKWWLVANAPEVLLEDVTTEEQLCKSKVLLKDNARESLIMVGNEIGLLSGKTEREMQMTRLVSKVSIGKLTPSFLATEEFENVEARLERVFLVNAQTSVYLDGTPCSDDMCNVGLLDTGLPVELSDLLVSTPAVSLNGAESCQLDVSLYCCPNPFEHTRLVLELAIGGETDYYPITLPPMQSNHEYHIEEAELLGWGSLSPDEPVDRKSIVFSIEVYPWENIDRSLILD